MSDLFPRLNKRLVRRLLHTGARFTRGQKELGLIATASALERLGLLPKEVHLTVRPGGGKLFGQKITARSEHQVIPYLVESDRARVAQTDQFMAMFPTVSFRQYQTRIEPGK